MEHSVDAGGRDLESHSGIRAAASPGRPVEVAIASLGQNSPGVVSIAWIPCELMKHRDLARRRRFVDHPASARCVPADLGGSIKVSVGALGWKIRGGAVRVTEGVRRQYTGGGELEECSVLPVVLLLRTAVETAALSLKRRVDRSAVIGSVGEIPQGGQGSGGCEFERRARPFGAAALRRSIEIAIDAKGHATVRTGAIGARG